MKFLFFIETYSVTELQLLFVTELQLLLLICIPLCYHRSNEKRNTVRWLCLIRKLFHLGVTFNISVTYYYCFMKNLTH